MYNIPFYLVPYLHEFSKETKINTILKCTIYTDIKYLNVYDVVIFSHNNAYQSPYKTKCSNPWKLDWTRRRLKFGKSKYEWMISNPRDANIERLYGKIFREKKLALTWCIRKQNLPFGCQFPSRRKVYFEHSQIYIFGINILIF